LNKHTLEIDSVELNFGERQILNSVYLKLETGSITGLLGCNGSGKSSLMKIMAGELLPMCKTMRIDSVWHNQFSEKELIYLPQDHYLPRNISVKRVLDDFEISHFDFTDIFPEFTPLMNQKIFKLSGGERRILEIYSVLRADTQFILLDEPFSQIMPLHIAKIKSLIIDAKRDKGILISDHMYRDIIDIADSLYVINNRTVYLTNELEDLVKHEYINNLI